MRFLALSARNDNGIRLPKTVVIPNEVRKLINI